MSTGEMSRDTEQEIGRLTGALGDLTRRRVFFALREAGVDQTKDDVASAVGIDRRLAGFHLDKLVECGFVTAELQRVGRPVGPGRPPKRYRVAHEGVLVAQPERHYDVLASLLLRAVREEGSASREALDRVGYAFGLELGLAEMAAGREQPSGASLTRALDGVARLLTTMGFGAVAQSSGGGVALCASSCPFEELAFDDPQRICGLDRAIWRGMIAAFAPDARITMDTARTDGDRDCRVLVEDVHR